MNAREFFYLVSQMRQAQQSYFQTRAQKDLRAAKYYETQVDLEIRRVKQVLSMVDDKMQSGGIDVS